MTTTSPNNITLMYVYKICITLFFHVPILTLFWQENGLSLTEVMILQSIFAISTVALEVPSGIFADLYGRRISLILAAAWCSLGLLLYCFADDFVSFLLAELAFAVWIALMSGADTAMIYDSLKQQHREYDFSKVWGSIFFYCTLALGMANAAAGFIGQYDLRWTFYFSLPFPMISLVAAYYLVEPDSKQNQQTLKQHINTIKQAFNHDRVLIPLMLYAALVFAFNQSGLWIYQPYFKIAGIELIYFGFIFGSFQFVAALAGKWAWRLENLIGYKTLLVSLIFMTALATLGLGLFLSLFSFVLVYLHQIVRGLHKVVIANQVNLRVESHYRASTHSVFALSTRLLYALIAPFIGWLADVYSIQQAFTVSGITALVCAIPSLWLLRRYAVI